MNWILKEIITKEYIKNVYHENWSKNPNNEGMLLSFSISKGEDIVIEVVGEFYNRYVRRELFIWGPNNYIGVFTRDVALHPDIVSPWYILSYHDPCWREDGVGRFLKYICICSSLSSGNFSNWYDVIPVPKECRKLLMDYPKHERHPIIK